MKTRYFVTLTAALTFSTAAFAADGGEAAFKASNCHACHATDRKSVGPALKDIARKYAVDKDAQAKLEKKVRSGGSGAFGTMPMPATPKTVSDGDITAMVTWVLSLK
ncbi:MAG: cytochrome C [Gallionellales bacterium RIFCSPLOWO2_02_FULL_57_47]|nr:MAG: cytochrome C [Gallionellales bacterium RIFCSPLOWO2_02_FULL_57_47]OGT15557.1 MAG: cytochrome C [Gallionellales bacterium RIFCSPHIGHO2_02_FULL_57_16]